MGNSQTNSNPEPVNPKKHSSSSRQNIAASAPLQPLPSPTSSDSSSNNSSPNPIKRNRGTPNSADHPSIHYSSSDDSDNDEVNSGGNIDIGNVGESDQIFIPPIVPSLGRLLIYNARIWVWDRDGLNRWESLFTDYCLSVEQHLYIEQITPIIHFPNHEHRMPLRKDISGHFSPMSWMTVNSLGRILEIGRQTELSGPDPASFDDSIDANGRLILPGLMDAHIHTLLTGQSSCYLDLKECQSIEQLQAAISTHMAKYPLASRLVGVNWDQVGPISQPASQLLVSQSSVSQSVSPVVGQSVS